VGALKYEAVTVEFDDVLLTHLHVVIVQQFRHQRSFPMSWLDALNDGDGRSTLWLTPVVPIYFKFVGSKVPEVDPEWIHRLTESSTSSAGLIVTDRAGRPVRAARTVRSWSATA
jgi:hypothetical protein